MAKIIVSISPEYTSTTYDATKWVIDDDGRLHIVGPNGNVASFNAGGWSLVEFSQHPGIHFEVNANTVDAAAQRITQSFGRH